MEYYTIGGYLITMQRDKGGLLTQVISGLLYLFPLL